MKHLIASTILCLSLISGCKKGSQCEDVYDHTLSLMPAEMQGKLKDHKSDAIEKCEKMSPEAKQCALDAKALEDLMKCPRQ